MNMSAEHIILVLSRVLSNSTGPITRALRVQLARIDSRTGRMGIDRVLEAAGKEALKPTASGKEIANLLPRARLLAAEMKRQKDLNTDFGADGELLR